MIVKAVVWTLILGSLGLSLFFGMQMVTGDQGRFIGHAVSAPDANDEVQLQGIATLLDAADGPSQFLANGTPDWDAWLVDHYRLRDSAGNPVEMTRGGGFRSQGIKESDAGTAELIWLAQLKAGDTHTLTFIPVVGQKEQYSREIPAVETEFSRVNFEPSY